MATIAEIGSAIVDPATSRIPYEASIDWMPQRAADVMSPSMKVPQAMLPPHNTT